MNTFTYKTSWTGKDSCRPVHGQISKTDIDFSYSVFKKMNITKRLSFEKI